MSKAVRAGTSHPRPPVRLFDEPVFGEGVESQDPSRFSTRHPSDTATFDAIHNLLKKQVVPFDKSRAAPGDLYELAAAYGTIGPKVVDAIKENGRIVFHSVGDTGASNVRNYSREIGVFDQIADDIHGAEEKDRPSFLFHLGDVVYNFGEAKYYFDQFYEPNRSYPAPIFAIPGNHDSFVVPGTAAGQEPLTTFGRNFCSEHPEITPEAGSLHRTAMTQPGVYFALDAPFVRILGLFSNALEDPGVISSEQGHWPGVPDSQLDFLAAQLKRVKDERFAGALIVAVHHPPFAYGPKGKKSGAGGNHAGSSAMLRQIDALCKDAGVYPHAFLSAHAHNYQRYTRTVRFGGKDYDVPFVVCGSGGHNVNPLVRAARGVPAQEPRFGSEVDYLENKPAVEAKGLILEKYNDTDYGYLRISVDKELLRIGFHAASNDSIAQSREDMVTVDLAGHTMVSN
jgi:hypothetical protein